MRVRQALNFAVDRERLSTLPSDQGLGQVTCQVIPPRFLGYRRYCPYTAEPSASGAWAAPDLARARQLVHASGTGGQAVTVRIPPEPRFYAAAGRYVVSVLDGLGFRARLRFTNEVTSCGYQAIFSGWYPDYAPPPTGMIVPTLTCSGYTPVAAENTNTAEFCDRAIDREIAQAQALQASDPQAAWRLWAKADRDLTDRAPWVSFANGVALEVKSTRVGNYQYNPQWGTLLAQLWVR